MVAAPNVKLDSSPTAATRVTLYVRSRTNMVVPLATAGGAALAREPAILIGPKPASRYFGRD